MRVRWLVVLAWVASVGFAAWEAAAAESSSPEARGMRRPLYAPHHPFDTDRALRTPRPVAGSADRSEPSAAQPQPAEREAPAVGAPAERPSSPVAAPDRPQPGTPVSGTPAPVSQVESPLTAEQQARLAELLEQYKADKITPQEYHRERARILRQR